MENDKKKNEEKFIWSFSNFKAAAEKLKSFEQKEGIVFNKESETWDALTQNN